MVLLLNVIKGTGEAKDFTVVKSQCSQDGAPLAAV